MLCRPFLPPCFAMAISMTLWVIFNYTLLFWNISTISLKVGTNLMCLLTSSNIKYLLHLTTSTFKFWQSIGPLWGQWKSTLYYKVSPAWAITIQNVLWILVRFEEVSLQRLDMLPYMLIKLFRCVSYSNVYSEGNQDIDFRMAKLC